MVAAADSVIDLYAYQQRFFADQARVLVAIWCRQAGKDFATACKAVDHAFRTGQKWFIVSLTQRQADATFEKCQTVATALKGAFKAAGEIVAVDGEEYLEHDAEIDHWFRHRGRTLHLPGGGSVTSLPGRDPDTLAGLTGNVIFTEFGLFPGGGYAHWRVVFPLATRGFKVIVISTPRGKNTKFHELVADPDTYSVHFVDIHRAVAEGMPLRGEDGRPITIDAFRALYGDEVGWRREYLCEFTGDLEALVKWAQLVAAGEAGKGLPFDWLRIENGAGWRSGFFQALRGESDFRPELGWDVARHANLSALWVNLGRRDRPKRLRHLVLMHECSFALQREVIREAMDAAPTAVGCGDATGLGMDSNETLATAYPGRWLEHTFTSAGWREVASLMVTAYGDGAQFIPPAAGETKFITTDIYAMQKESGGAQLKVTATPNPLLDESHCDVGCANGLALKAGLVANAQPFVSVH